MVSASSDSNRFGFVFVQIEKKMYMFKLKKWICSNWRIVFVQIKDMYLFKLKQTYLFKFTKCICLNWKNIFVWIEKMHLFELKKCIWLNWKHVFVWIGKMYLIELKKWKNLSSVWLQPPNGIGCSQFEQICPTNCQKLIQITFPQVQLLSGSFAI